MARSRRRIISRQGNFSSRFSYGVWAKWILIALGLGGGTFGVHQIVTSIPSGAIADSSGTEVGPHLAEVASSQKPPLPDEPQSGVAGVFPPPNNRLAQANDSAPSGRSAPNPAAPPSGLPGQLPNPSSSSSNPATGNPGLPTGTGPGSLDRSLASSLSSAAASGTAPGPSGLPSPRALGDSNNSGNPGPPNSLPNPIASGTTAPPPSSGLPTGPANPAALAANPSGGTESNLRTPGRLPGALPDSLPTASGVAAAAVLTEADENSAAPPPRPVDSSASTQLAAGTMRGNPPGIPNFPPPTLNPAGSSPNPTGPSNDNSLANNPNIPRLNSAPTPAPGSTPAPSSGPATPSTIPGTNPTLPTNPAALGAPALPGASSLASSPNPLPAPGPGPAGSPPTNPLSGPLSSPLPNGNGPSGSLSSGSALSSPPNLASNTASNPAAGLASTPPSSTPTPSTLPPSSPTIGIPSESRLAAPNPSAAAAMNPASNPLPRSAASAGLPQPDPLASDPRRTPAAPTSFGGNPNNPNNLGTNPNNFNNSTNNFGQDAGRLASNTPPTTAAGFNPGARLPATLVSNRPGDPQWEIQQQAALVIEKLAPPAVQVNVPAKFLMVVRNVGRVPAGQVLIRDRVPEKARLIQATPKPTRQDGDLLEWELAALPPGEAYQIQLELLPTEPGEIGSVAQVISSAVAATRTRSTRPQLSIEHAAPPQVMVGQTVVMNIVVRNEGDGVAENVVIREIVPPQMMHPSGNEIENPLGNLAPGQTRTLQLPLVARTPGTARNTIRVTGEGKLSAEHSIDIQIVAPQLQVLGDGPERRFLSRPATHTFQVKNLGSANATNVQMMARLPQGLRYDSSSPAGRYDPSRHAVFWAMANLPSNAEQSVTLTTMPMAPGEQPIEFQALADLNQPQVTTRTLLVEQLSELFFDIDDLQDPIEVGTNTMYVIRVENQGSQVANNVAMVVDFPAGVEPLNVESPIEYQLQRDGQTSRLVFAPVANMNPRAQMVIRVEARGSREGDHRIEVRMTSAQRPTPVSKQESTKVYADR